MSKAIPLTKWAFILVIIGSGLTGCQKIHDFVHFPFKGDTEFKLCEIKKVTVVPDRQGDFVTHYSFNYNRKGDPVTVMNDDVSTGNPNAWFKYDKSGRLTEFIRPYENNAFESWDKYGYNNLNQIVVDTQYIFGDFIDSVPVLSEITGSRTITRLEYDQQNRIISELDSTQFRRISETGSIFFGGNAEVVYKTWSYNNDGNQFYTTYDNKVSILRTNKIWMFLKRDYSVNNAFPVIQYNAFGLPEIFLAAHPHSDTAAYEPLGILVPRDGTYHVEYSCH
jgi:YD repeat-containing protein